MTFHCKYDELVDASALREAFHPKNRNKHSDDQVDGLIKILDYQGWRYPVKISNRSKKITSGHGRVLAALKMGWQVPVNYQDYDSDEQEYADVQSDNAIAAWSELDLVSISDDVKYLPEDFDLDLLGIRDFKVEIPESDIDDGFVDPGEKKYIIEAQFPNEMEMMDYHDDLLHRGYIVKIK